MNASFSSIGWLLALCLSISAASAATIYVNHAATGSNNGTSWTDAYTDLQVAMNAAAVGDEIWVAAGTYKPTQKPTGVTIPVNRLKTFYLNKDVKIYGGFVGTETLLSQRDHVANVTILSGDIGTVGDASDNCYHVFITTGLTAAGVIDGFTITDGNGNNSNVITYSGVSFYSSGGGGFCNASSSPTLTNVTVSENAADNGGGFYNESASPTLINVTVSNNTADIGGGFYNVSSSSPTLINARISKNTANTGGGFANYAYSSPTLLNVVVSGNTSVGAGSAFMNYGGSSPVLINVTISGNIANSGGSFANYSSSAPKVRNSIIWNNGSSEVYNSSSSKATFSHTLVKGSGGSSAWNTTYGVDSGNNLDADPIFLGLNDFRLIAGSPALNAGNNAYNNTSTDLNGNTRIQSDTIDLGAIEGSHPQPLRFYVKHDATGANNGTSWADAFTDLQDALNAATRWQSDIWVAAGTYKPTQKPTGVSGLDARFQTFYLNQDVRLFGGFVGTETQLSQRDHIANITILSGDIGTVGTNGDNCYHVFIGIGLTPSTLIDGFTVSDGNANAINYMTYEGVQVGSDVGGGFSYYDSSPMLANLTVSNNTAKTGGGFCNDNSSPTLTNVVVSENTAFNIGGGFYNSFSSPTLTNVTVLNNTAFYGGGFANFVYSSPTLTNTIVSGNTAADYGGGFYNYYYSSPTLTDVVVSENTAHSEAGGLLNYYYSSPTLTNVVVTGNTAHFGGGFSNGYLSSLTLTNVTVTGNNADSAGGSFFMYDTSSVTVTNSIIWENGNSELLNYGNTNTAVFSYSLVKGSGSSNAWNTAYGIDSGNNLDADPLFVSATDFALQVGSPAINAGNNAYNTTATDLAGNQRIQDGTIDLGAYEGAKSVATTEPNKTLLAALLYPNPTNTELNIALQNGAVGEVRIAIFTSTGQLVYAYAPTDAVTRINTANWTNGLYFLNIQAGTYTSSQKVVIQH